MALPILAKIGIAAGLGAGIYWLMGGTATVGDAATASALGTKDGCAQGTRDAKAGQSEALNPTDDDDVHAAAKKSGNPDAYFAAYSSAYSDCFKKNAPVTKVDLPGVTPKKPAPKPTPPPAKAYLDRFTAMNSYLNGARQGARDGFKDGIAKTSVNYEPGSGGAGIPRAYRAGYGCGYTNGKSEASVFDGMPSSLTPESLPTTQENHIVDSICAGQFGAWYDAHKGDASVSGVLRVGNLALVGARRRPVDVDALHADMARHFAPMASSRHGWPAPPEDDGTSTLYRSY